MSKPDKFQCIVFGKKRRMNVLPLLIAKLTPLESCKLLGVEVDRKLTFRTHRGMLQGRETDLAI